MVSRSLSSKGPVLSSTESDDGHLAQVVQGGRSGDKVRALLRETQLASEQAAQLAHAVGVLARGVVAVLGHATEAVEDLDVRLLQLGRAAPHQLLQNAATSLTLQAHEAGLEQRAHVGGEDLQVDGLGEKVVGACLQGLEAGLGFGQPADHEHGQETCLR